jgi:hypothetical protein
MSMNNQERRKMDELLVSRTLDFLKENHANMVAFRIGNSEFWLETPDRSVTARFMIDDGNREVLYDVYLPEYYVHLKEETLEDVEKIESRAEEHGRWKLAECLENMWLLLDEIRILAKKNKFKFEENKVI